MVGEFIINLLTVIDIGLKLRRLAMGRIVSLPSAGASWTALDIRTKLAAVESS